MQFSDLDFTFVSMYFDNKMIAMKLVRKSLLTAFNKTDEILLSNYHASDIWKIRIVW